MSTNYWDNIRRVSDEAEINDALKRTDRVKASPTAMDEMRRRFPPPDPPVPEASIQRLFGTPVDIDPNVPEGFAFAGGVLLDFRSPLTE